VDQEISDRFKRAAAAAVPEVQVAAAMELTEIRGLEALVVRAGVGQVATECLSRILDLAALSVAVVAAPPGHLPEAGLVARSGSSIQRQAIIAAVFSGYSMLKPSTRLPGRV
jgi:hypothetical protein